MRFWILALSFVALLPAQTVSDLLEAKLAARIAEYDSKMQGSLGVALIDIETGHRWSYHGKTVFPQASLIKVPILIEMFRLRETGQLRFDEQVTLQPAEMIGGSGVLQLRLKNGPITVTVEELVREMIASSDNTATNWCIRRAGMANINQTTARLGFHQTRLQRIMLDQAAASRGDENISTPEEMAEIVLRIYQNKALSPASCAGMIAMMKLVKGGMRAGLPAGVELASKTGEMTGVRTQTGIVYLEGRPFVLSVMGTYLAEPNSPVEAVTRMVFAHFELLAKGNIYGNLGVR